jgi:hypothetical protein
MCHLIHPLTYYFEDLTMQSQAVRPKEEVFWIVLRYTLAAIGTIVFALAIPNIPMFFRADPLTAIIFLVASVGFVFTVRRIR